MQRCWDHDRHSRPKASEVSLTLESSVSHLFWRSSIHNFDRVLVYSDLPAWKRLIIPALSAEERIELIKYIFSDRDEFEVFERLSGSDAQAFVDVIGEARIRILSSLKICRPNLANTSVLCRLVVG